MSTVEVGDDMQFAGDGSALAPSGAAGTLGRFDAGVLFCEEQVQRSVRPYIRCLM